MRSPLRALELVLVLTLVAGGTWLRWHHLGTPSLWWDELVHLRTAEQPTAAAVWRSARIGLAPGTGNAGAVPLDYLALHAWLVATPRPAPTAIERHYRMPAFAFAVAALPLVWAVTRRIAGPVAGVIALALLATSIPHLLYAADVRFYSLYVLATLASLAAFEALVRGPSLGRTLGLALVNVAYVLSALYGIFPIAAEYLALLAMAWASRRDASGRRLAGAAVGGGALALVVLGLYLAPSAVTTIYPRGPSDAHGPVSAIADTLGFFGAGSRPRALALGLSIALAPLLARTVAARAVAGVAVLSTCAIPGIVAIAQWKHYYYHPRHALFLLPLAVVSTAIVLAAVLERATRRPALAMVAGASLAVTTGLPALLAYVANPLPFFHQTKTLRDFRGLAELVATRTAGLAPGERYLLVLERRRPGHLANPMVAFYLRAYGLADRVMLVGTGDPTATLAHMPAACPRRCRGAFDVALFGALGVGDPFDQPPFTRRFLDLRPSQWANVGGAGLVAWAPNVPPGVPPGTTKVALDGLALFEPQ